MISMNIAFNFVIHCLDSVDHNYNYVIQFKAMSCNIIVSPSPAHVHFLVLHLKLLSLKSIENGHAFAVKLAGLVQNYIYK